MNAKCANCGADMDVSESGNWSLYCAKDACKEAFMAEVLARATQPKRSKKKPANAGHISG